MSLLWALRPRTIVSRAHWRSLIVGKSFSSDEAVGGILQAAKYYEIVSSKWKSTEGDSIAAAVLLIDRNWRASESQLLDPRLVNRFFLNSIGKIQPRNVITGFVDRVLSPNVKPMLSLLLISQAEHISIKLKSSWSEGDNEIHTHKNLHEVENNHENMRDQSNWDWTMGDNEEHNARMWIAIGELPFLESSFLASLIKKQDSMIGITLNIDIFNSGYPLSLACNDLNIMKGGVCISLGNRIPRYNIISDPKEVSPIYTITGCQGNIIRTLDDEKALKILMLAAKDKTDRERAVVAKVLGNDGAPRYYNILGGGMGKGTIALQAPCNLAISEHVQFIIESFKPDNEVLNSQLDLERPNAVIMRDTTGTTNPYLGSNKSRDMFSVSTESAIVLKSPNASHWILNTNGGYCTI